MQNFDCDGTRRNPVSVNKNRRRAIQFERSDALPISGEAFRHFLAIHVFFEPLQIQLQLRGTFDESRTMSAAFSQIRRFS